MKRKIDRLARIERLRKQMHELSSWRLALVAQEREKLRDDHAAMIEALGDGLTCYGAPAAAGTRHVRAVERRLAVAGVIEKELGKRVLDHGRLAKLADKGLTRARETWGQTQERRSLEALIEATVATDTASRKR